MERTEIRGANCPHKGLMSCRQLFVNAGDHHEKIFLLNHRGLAGHCGRFV